MIIPEDRLLLRYSDREPGTVFEHTDQINAAPARNNSRNVRFSLHFLGGFPPVDRS